MIFSTSAPTFVPFSELKKLHDNLTREHAYHSQACFELWIVYNCTKNYVTNHIFHQLFLNSSYSVRRAEFSIIVAEHKASMNTVPNDYQAAFLLNATRKFLDPSVTFDKKNFNLLDEIFMMTTILHDPPPSKLSGLIDRLAICIHALNRVIKCV